MSQRCITHVRSHWRGFGLIENLVAVAIVSISLLGPAAMLNQSLVMLRESRSRQIAIVLAEDLANRLYALRRRWDAPGTSQDCVAEPPACFNDAQSIAEFTGWQSEVTASLPNGDAAVHMTATMPLIGVEIVVNWAQSDSMQAQHRLLINLQAS